MDSSIRIDLSQGIVEASGPETFVAAVFDQFKAQLAEVPVRGRITPPPSSAKPEKTTGATRSRSTKASQSSKAESHALVKDLDLSGGDAGVSLRDFCQQFATKNARQRNLIFAVYLRDHTGVDTITADHIYTCWRSVVQ